MENTMANCWLMQMHVSVNLSPPTVSHRDILSMPPFCRTWCL